MPIKAPAWCNTAVPDMKRGWVDPDTGELLVSSKFTQAQVDEFYGIHDNFQELQDMNQYGKIEAAMAAAGFVEEENEDMLADLNDDGVIDDLESMTKLELEELGREHGIELDRRKSKAILVETMREYLSK